MTSSPHSGKSNAILYLARGATTGDFANFERFVASYQRFDAGVDHELYVIFKGYQSASHLAAGQAKFSGLRYHAIFTSDDSFDIGAYRDSLAHLSQDNVCLFNTHSEIACDNWLAKLAANLHQPYVGIVGATGSLESLNLIDSPGFPNAHIRSNAFMMRRTLLRDILAPEQIREKRDTFGLESGARSITRRVFERGLTALVVARDGRGYPPHLWATSKTFRLGAQANLLAHDNQTRYFEHAPQREKQRLHDLSWGLKSGDMASFLPAVMPLQRA
jgi:hypothetical protein